MELFQVLWDDQRNLVLEFREDQGFPLVQDPQDLKSLNLKYEISKIDPQQGYPNTLPTLISIKDFNEFQDRLLFKVDMRDIMEPEELQINFINLTLILQDGTRKKVNLKTTLNLDDIIIDEEYYDTMINQAKRTLPNEIDKSKSINASISQEQIYRERKTDLSKNKQKDVFVYQKNSASFSAGSNDFISAIQENSKRLASVEKELQNLTSMLKGLSSKNLNLAPANPPPMLKSPPGVKPPPIKRLPLQKPRPISSNRLPFLGELSSIIEKNLEKNSEFNFRDILKPMDEKELEKVTLKDEQLKEREDVFYRRQIERVAEEKAKEAG